MIVLTLAMLLLHCIALESPISRPSIRTAAHAQAPAAVPAMAGPAMSVQAVVVQYAALVHANYAGTLAAARAMQTAIQAFTAKPSEQTLAQARKS